MWCLQMPAIYEQMPYDKVTEELYDEGVDINVKGVPSPFRKHFR